MESARKLGTVAIFPLTSLSFMLLRWQPEESEGDTLSDSEDDGDGLDDNGEPIVRYATEEQYRSYVPSPPLPSQITDAEEPRRMDKIESHYATLGAKLFLEANPDLENYLSENVDEKLVSRVCHPPQSYTPSP